MKELPVNIQRQQRDNWCWAAVAASTAGFYRGGAAPSQCQVASAELNVQPDCCSDPAPCDQFWYLDRALGNLGHLRAWSGPESYEITSAEIDGECPLGVRIEWSGGGGGHFVLVTGYDEQSQVVTVKDPADGGVSVVPFDVLKDSYLGVGRWTHSYFTKA